MKQFSATLLAIIHLMSAVVLLSVSAWFIAACAIAGHAGVLAGFNYVVPATIIRFLAVIRLASGYFEKYFGHLALLEQLQKIRYRLLISAFSQQDIKQSEAGQTLQQETEHAAARWSALYSPLFSSSITLLGLTLLMAMLFKELVTAWFVLLTIVSVLLILFLIMTRHAEKVSKQALQESLFDQRQWLHTSTLWPLTPQSQKIERLIKQALSAGNKKLIQKNLLGYFDTLLVCLALIWLIFFALTTGQNQSASAIWAVPFIILISIRDWLLPAFSATTQPTGQTWSDQPNNLNTTETGTQIKTPKLVLNNFQWKRAGHTGNPISCSLNGTGLVFLAAPSGSGKSSFFQALTGELPFTGNSLLANDNLNELTHHEIRKHIHFAEQFGHVFSATLRDNLLITSNKSDEALINALEWAELNSWCHNESLNLWIGDTGQPISGGEQKRLLLARAYLSDASILLLDEPFEAMDFETVLSIAEKLNNLAKDRLILIASHIQPDNLLIDKTINFH